MVDPRASGPAASCAARSSGTAPRARARGRGACRRRTSSPRSGTGTPPTGGAAGLVEDHRTARRAYDTHELSLGSRRSGTRRSSRRAPACGDAGRDRPAVAGPTTTPPRMPSCASSASAAAARPLRLAVPLVLAVGRGASTGAGFFAAASSPAAGSASARRRRRRRRLPARPRASRRAASWPAQQPRARPGARRRRPARLGGAAAATASAAALGDRRGASASAGRAGLGGGSLGGDAQRLGGGDVAPDVDPPAGQPGGEPGVLALAADRQREHPLGHGDGRDPVLLVDGRRRAPGPGDSALATNTAASSFQGMTSIFSPPSSATTAWTRAPRWPTVAPTGSRPSWRERDGDLGAAAGLARDGLDLDRAGVDLGHLELEQAAQEVLVRAADEDLRPARGAPDLEHVRLDVLADAVVLERALLAGGAGPPRRPCRRRG